MDYEKKFFDVEETESTLARHLGEKKPRPGDRRDGLVYRYTEQIELTVNVAHATGRPILLRGPSGSGKSSLAKNIALRLGRRYYEEVITSTTQSTDLQWRFDPLRRFNDAQSRKMKDDANYLEPRALWWAFSPDTAERRGREKLAKGEAKAKDPSELPGAEAVVLIDEIDKADPDVPNNLLVTLGSLVFKVPHLKDFEVRAESAPLVFITSNDERDLPAAFLRRCITLQLEPPAPKQLIEIASDHFENTRAKRKLYQAVADLLYPKDAVRAAPVSTAEYLDAVQACIALKVAPKKDDEVWECIVRTTARKSGRA